MFYHSVDDPTLSLWEFMLDYPNFRGNLKVGVFVYIEINGGNWGKPLRDGLIWILEHLDGV